MSPVLLTGSVVLPDRVVADGAVVLDGDRIAFAGGLADAPAADPATLPHGVRLLPGLVDLHCHGGAGAEFGPDPAASGVAAGHHHRHGTTSLLASLVAASPATLADGVRAGAGATRDGDVAGVHAEGPFLSPARPGAQDPDALAPVDLDLVRALIDVAGDSLRVMTYAPELDRADPLVDLLAGAGVVPAVGHTDADAATTARALGRAADALGRPALVTHLFNAMRTLHHRDPGPVAASLAAAARGEAVVELVADGVHLADETATMVFDVAGPASVALVTDATAASGMTDGRYRLGRLDVVVDGRTARLADGGALAGGVGTLLDVVRRCVGAGVPLVDAVRAASTTPASVLGLRDGGSLRAGARADVLAVDEDLGLVAVWRHGKRLGVTGT